MFILRTKTDDGIKTFVFHQPIIPGTTAKMAREAEFEAAHKASNYIMRTSAAGFIAEVNSPEDTRGALVKKWDHKRRLWKDMYVRQLNYTVDSGRYRDRVWAVLGTEEECRTMADETNAKAECWADIRCHIEHLVGPLWQCVYCDPYKD